MANKTFCWALVALAGVASSPALAQQPPPTYYPPPPGYQPPPPAYQQAPPPNYQQPPPNYQQPPPNYQQPPPNYQQPPPNYQQPPPGYQQPPPGYQQPPSGYPNAQGAAAPAAVYAAKPQGFQYHPWRVQIEGGYTITSGDTKNWWQNGGNVGAGITWFPVKGLPFGFRVDGSYSVFDATPAGVAAASKSLGTTIGSGRLEMYGGDADGELDLQMGPKVREYLFGGFGWYRQRTSYDQVQYQYGLICYFYCYPGYFPVTTTVDRTTSDWMRSWNAGIGFEFALQDPLSFFVEARYLRLYPQSNNSVFIPIRVGLRF
jgi:opacity protein-like surface antigen